MLRSKDMFSVHDVLSSDITVLNSSVICEFHVSLGVRSTNPPLCCTGFLCAVIVTKGIFSLICRYSIEEDRRSLPH
jgi:hypothetical protein